jgi:superfamily I DNA/RNA helicase
MTTAWSPYQQAVFDAGLTTRDNLVVEAVAGSGKTTTMLELIARILAAFGSTKVFFGAFNKKIAVEIGAKLNRLGLNNASAKTIHAVGFSTLAFANGRNTKTEVVKDKVENLIAAKVLERPDLAPFATFVGKAVAMAKKIGIGLPEVCAINDVAAWQDMIDFYGLDTSLSEADDERMDKAIAFAIAILKASNRDRTTIDFDDMVYLALVYNLRPLQYDVVIIDEAQDLNMTRLLLASRMVKPNGRFIAVGDPHQAIYGFTGALSDSMQRIVSMFKAKVLPLSVTYRSAKSIVRAAQAYVPHIQPREGADEGVVVDCDGGQFFAADFLATDAVLCRNNAPLIPAAFSALRRGITCRIEGRDIGKGLIALTYKWKRVASLDSLRTKLADWKEREVTKAAAKKNDARVALVTDQFDTIAFFIDEEIARKGDLASMRARIEGMFSDSYDADGKPAKPMLTFCSYHKSKGLEWRRVYLLDHDKYCPSPYATQAWQLQQESNLAYVAITRAMDTLVRVNTDAQEVALAA